MENKIQERLNKLREIMKAQDLSAFIFPSTDPHQGEYIPDHWKGREWISGFDGSAGTAVVTLKSAALWTDSRYFIAAEEQLKGTDYVLMKERIEGTPSISEWLASEFKGCDNVNIGIDGSVCSNAFVSDLVWDLSDCGDFFIRTDFDPLKNIWNDRPEIPKNKVEIQPLEFAGETVASKLERIRKALAAQQADGIIVSALDEIAWTLNLRGSDVHCNPVFVAYLLIEATRTRLFIDADKLTDEVKTYLNKEQIEVADYNDVLVALEHYSGESLLLDENQLNYNVFNAVEEERSVEASSPIPMMKAIKNEAEIKGFKRAMIRDCVAMVKFLKWLKPAVKAGGQTEISLEQKLTALRAEQDLFKGISFDTIVGYEAHGAIVHYEATTETDIPIEPRGLVLIDSGAQYQDGTTDITRTIALGEITEEQRRIYTLVLKGHIQLDLCKFPNGACGSQVDAFARQAMWREGYNFMHGTGHGVGSYLNVHEGPHQIRMEWRPAPLRAGMTVTNEPGIYLAGKFGVRIENTEYIKPYKTTEFGEFLQFEPLTLAPIDTTPIDFSMLTKEEIEWFNQYHTRVYETLSPYLNSEEQAWLKANTATIKSE